MQRKIIQIAVQSEGDSTMPGLFALCDDGSILGYTTPENEWFEVPPIPQKPVERNFIGQVKDKLSDAYQEAYTAGYNCQPESLNFYQPESKEAYQWRMGYVEGIKG